MQAIVYTEYGPPDRLHLEEVAMPAPKEHEVLVKVHAVSVNASDWRLLMARPFLARLHNGLLKPHRHVLGSDVAGVVEATGDRVKVFKRGDAVFGDLMTFGCGGFAEYACAREDAWAIKPPKLSFEEAAALPMAGITALQGLRDTAKLQPGQTVLINGASGGVGTFAIQIAKYLGAEVTAVCSTSKLELVRTLGADHVIDYTREDFTKGDLRYDVIFAVNGYHSILDYKQALSPDGIYVMAGGSSAQIFQAMLAGPPIFMLGHRRMALAFTKANRADLELLAALVCQGRVKPVIDERYPLSAVPEAVRYVVEGHPRGKAIICVA